LLANMGLAKDHVALMHRGEGARAFKLDLPFAPIYIGIGGLLTLATALLVFGGSLLRLIGDYLLAGIAAGTDQAERFPDTSMRWVGGAAMTVAVVYSLVKFMRPRVAGALASDELGDPALVEISPQRKMGQMAAIALGILMLFGWIVAKDGFGVFAFAMGGTVLVMCMLMVTLGALLSLQIGSSASPVSGTIFVTTLVLCLVSLKVGHHEIDDVLLLTPLIVGACVAVCTANDSSQDYKTLQLCGVKVQDGFLAQILGLIAGAFVVPIVMYVAHGAYTLGSDDLPAPQGQMFATLVNGLLLESKLPWTPILIGTALGAFAVGMEILGSKRKIQLPAMALAVGIYLPAAIGIGILIGATFRWLAERKHGRQTHESILAAAGLITGAAALELILGIAILGIPGWTPARLAVASPPGDTVTSVLAILGILALGGLLYVNSKRRAA